MSLDICKEIVGNTAKFIKALIEDNLITASDFDDSSKLENINGWKKRISTSINQHIFTSAHLPAVGWSTHLHISISTHQSIYTRASRRMVNPSILSFFLVGLPHFRYFCLNLEPI